MLYWALAFLVFRDHRRAVRLRCNRECSSRNCQDPVLPLPRRLYYQRHLWAVAARNECVRRHWHGMPAGALPGSR